MIVFHQKLDSEVTIQSLLYKNRFFCLSLFLWTFRKTIFKKNFLPFIYYIPSMYFSSSEIHHLPHSSVHKSIKKLKCFHRYSSPRVFPLMLTKAVDSVLCCWHICLPTVKFWDNVLHHVHSLEAIENERYTHGKLFLSWLQLPCDLRVMVAVEKDA